MTRPSQPVQQNSENSSIRSMARAVGTALVRWSDGIDPAVRSEPTSTSTSMPEKPKDRTWVERLLASSNTTALDLQGVDMSGADLSNLDLSGTNFARAVLTGISFQGAKLASADFRGADCQNCNFLDADLRYAMFYTADIQSCRFTAYSFYSDTRRLPRRYLLGDIVMANQTDEIADFHHAREAALSISRAMYENGQFAKAASFRVLAMRLDRATENPIRRWRRFGRVEDARGRLFKIALFVYYGIRWMGAVVADLLCVYGESVWRVLFWMTAILLVLGPFAVLLAGGLNWPTEAAGTYLGLPQFWQQTLYAYSQYILYMFDTFTTANFSLMEPQNDAVRLVSAFLAMTGIFLTGLLGFVAGNRIRRV